MGRYKTLMDIGISKMDKYKGLLFLMAFFFGGLYAIGMAQQDWASEHGLFALILLTLVSFLGMTITSYLFFLMPIGVLFWLRNLKREFGPATVRDLWDHYSASPQQSFDITQAAIENGDYFRVTRPAKTADPRKNCQ